MFLVESRERLDDIRKWRSRWWGHDGSGVPASFPGLGTSVTKFVGRKEADRVGSWRLRYFYLRQINSHRCALCVTRKHQLSRSSPRSLSVFVPTVSLWQLVRSSLRLSLWTAVPRRLLSGLHANYCNQTQVILILHLTHLLTAVSWVFLPLQTSLNHAPLATHVLTPSLWTVFDYLKNKIISIIHTVPFHSSWTLSFEKQQGNEHQFNITNKH